jgi:bifunctional ADP-heptose synthase (sugar kinase/adenylyltransferase)
MNKPHARYLNQALHRESDLREIPMLRPLEAKYLPLPRPVVLINGAFDLLHASHMRLIFAARRKGATVVCALDSDEKVCKAKGPGRPVLNFNERLATLNYMPIDYIVEIHNERDMRTLVSGLRPDLRVQGEEYLGQPSRFAASKSLVREGALHTSDIISRIQGIPHGKTKTS